MQMAWKSWSPLAATLLVAFAGCRSGEKVPAVQLSHVEYPSTGQEKAPPPSDDPPTSGSRPLKPPGRASEGAWTSSSGSPRADVAPTTSQPQKVRGLFDNFAREVARTAGGAGSIGVLPLVTYDYRRRGPWVCELAVRVADDLATGIADAGYHGQVLPPAGVEARLAEMNMEKRAISTLAAVAEQGDRVGVDAVVFGTIKHTIDTGASGREVLTLAVSAYDFGSGRIVASDEVEISSDRQENRGTFDLAQRDSLWLPGDRWQVPDTEKTFDREIAAVTDVLARRVAGSIDLKTFEGAAYVPVTDTAPYARVAGAAAGPNPGSRFGAQLSTMFAEKLRPKLQAHELRVLDAGLANAAEAPVVEQGLATGAVTTGSPAARALGASGIGLVAVPRLERFGARFVLRVECYDLRTGRLASSTHVPIAARFEPDLAREVGLAPANEPAPAPALPPPG